VNADRDVRELGARVVDVDDEDPNEAVVVNLPPVPAAEWIAYVDDGEEVTVADDNPEYNAAAEVVVVAFADEFDAAHPTWNADNPLPLGEADCATYAFPPGRLKRVDDTDPEALLTDGQAALRERLAESATVDVERVADHAVLVVEKLGREHRIVPGGQVSGPLAGQLQPIAAEYLGGGRA
jgi:hypothetical protein